MEAVEAVDGGFESEFAAGDLELLDEIGWASRRSNSTSAAGDERKLGSRWRCLQFVVVQQPETNSVILPLHLARIG